MIGFQVPESAIDCNPDAHKAKLSTQVEVLPCEFEMASSRTQMAISVSACVLQIARVAATVANAL
jgi:hypothetical protein